MRHMNQLERNGLVVLVALAVLGCGADDAAPSGSTATYEGFTSEVASQLCARLYACCEASELTEKFMTTDPPVTDAASCERLYGAVGRALALGVQQSIDDGETTYDRASADVIVAWLEEARCEEVRAYAFGDYEDPLAGTLPDGAPCGDADWRCAGGACIEDPAGVEDGVCATLPAAGAPCTDQCARGAFCRWSDEAHSGAACVALLAIGAPCTHDNECVSDECEIVEGATWGSCVELDQCTEGLLRVSVRCGPCPAEATGAAP